MTKLELLIIDPQNDFCDNKGALFVPGATEDMHRLSTMINRLKEKIFDIHVTLDTHHYVDIAHPVFWIDSNGKEPAPFTIITEQDIVSGKLKPRNPNWENRILQYVKDLESGGRYPLCIWPSHCLIGSWGTSVIPTVYSTLLDWEKRFNLVDFVTKGSNFWVEHYSAVKAEVEDASDPTTGLNTRLIQILQDADIIALSGEALSHCVANTVRDIANNFGEENIKKLVLLEDTCSSVSGFEKLGEDFIKEMTQRGMQVSKSVDFFN